MEITQPRLQAAVRHFGWGPKHGPVAFHRNGNGWRLGNGTVVTPWDGQEVPNDPEQALLDIWAYNQSFLDFVGA